MGERIASETRSERVRRHGPRFFLAAIFVVGLAAALLGDGGWLAARQLESTVARQAAEIDARGAELESLRLRIDALREDAEARERIAREQLGYAGRGEVIFLLPRDEEVSPAP